jgi:hypothetical protein
MDERAPDSAPIEPPLHLNDGTGRFAPGHKKLGGRKKGDRCKATMMAERLFASNLRSVAKVVVAEAKDSHQSWACKLVIERILPPAKDTPIQFKLGPVRTASEVSAAIQDMLVQVALGAMSMTDAERVIGMLALLVKAFEAIDHEGRLAALEERLEQAGINGKSYELHGGDLRA